MAKQDALKTIGTIVEKLPNTLFRVQLDMVDKIILCHISGKMRIHNINLMIGDKVEIEMSPYDMTKGRIVFRKR